MGVRCDAPTRTTLHSRGVCAHLPNISPNYFIFPPLRTPTQHIALPFHSITTASHRPTNLLMPLILAILLVLLVPPRHCFSPFDNVHDPTQAQ